MATPERSGVAAMVPIRVLGRDVAVPRGLTILKAMEYAGHRLVTGVGCRGGFCGACSTVYRIRGDYRLRPALACQTTVEPGMVLASIPATPANRAAYDLERTVPGEPTTLLAAYYPELARCVACNTCTKACPQELQVMDYIQAALRDDLEGVARESFDCLQCGLCALRCPADIPHPHLAQLARRVYGRHVVPASPRLRARIAAMAAGEYRSELDELIAMDAGALRARYAARDIEQAP